MRKVIALALAGLLASAGGAAAQSTLEGEVTVVHGINGMDLGLDEALPVDIAVNGGCALEDVPFRTISDAIALPAGSYAIDVSLSDGVEGNCDASLLAFSGTADLAVAESATLVAHLDQNGAARLSQFSNQVGPIAPGDTRVAVIHAAAAPAVDEKTSMTPMASFMKLSTSVMPHFPRP